MELQALNKEKETLSPIAQRNSTIHGSSAFEDDSDDDFILNYFREQYFYDRQGDRDNIIRVNTIQNNTIINDPPHTNLSTTDDPIELPHQFDQDMISRVNRASVIAAERRTPIRGNWVRTGQGTWVPRTGAIDLLSDSEDDYSF